MKVDSAMAIVTTSKTWNPKVDDQIWHRQSKGDEYRWSSSASSTQWRPRLRSDKDFSSVAGNTSEGSKAFPGLGSIDEHEGEALRDWHVRHPRHQIAECRGCIVSKASLSPRCCGGPPCVSWIDHGSSDYASVRRGLALECRLLCDYGMAECLTLL